MKKYLFLCFAFLFTAPVWGDTALTAEGVHTGRYNAGVENPVPTADDLTLREQVGQTIMPRVLIGEQKAFKKAVLNGEVTGFFIKAKEGAVTQPKITAKNQARFIARQRKRLEKTIRDLNKWAAKSPHKIPLLLAVDYEGGTVTSPMFMGLKQMPSNMLLAASGDEKVVADMYAAQAKEILLSGANTALGPVTDVNSNPLNPISKRVRLGIIPPTSAAFQGRLRRRLKITGCRLLPSISRGTGIPRPIPITNSP